MRCIKCGYENLEGLKYCSNCGDELLTQDEATKRKREKRSKAAIKFVVILLILALIATVTSYIIINNKNKKEQEQQTNYQVVNVLIGTWNCSTSKEMKTFEEQFVLKNDSTYVWGTYNKLNSDSTSGMYSANDVGVFPQDGTYELYSLMLDVKHTIKLGIDVEVTKETIMNYNVALSQDNTKLIVANGTTGSGNMYCVRAQV